MEKIFIIISLLFFLQTHASQPAKPSLKLIQDLTVKVKDFLIKKNNLIYKLTCNSYMGKLDICYKDYLMHKSQIEYLLKFIKISLSLPIIIYILKFSYHSLKYNFSKLINYFNIRKNLIQLSDNKNKILNETYETYPGLFNGDENLKSNFESQLMSETPFLNEYYQQKEQLWNNYKSEISLINFINNKYINKLSEITLKSTILCFIAYKIKKSCMQETISIFNSYYSLLSLTLNS